MSQKKMKTIVLSQYVVSKHMIRRYQTAFKKIYTLEWIISMKKSQKNIVAQCSNVVQDRTI